MQNFMFFCHNIRRKAKISANTLDLEGNVRPHHAHWLCNWSAALLWLCIHSLHILKLIFFFMKPSYFESTGQRVFSDWRSSIL